VGACGSVVRDDLPFPLWESPQDRHLGGGVGGESNTGPIPYKAYRRRIRIKIKISRRQPMATRPARLHFAFRMMTHLPDDQALAFG